jgi:hypothetical protein
VIAGRLAAEAQVQVTPVAVSPVTRWLLDLTEIDLFNDQLRRETPGDPPGPDPDPATS